MKINNVFFIMAVCISFILLSIAYFGLTIDWKTFSGITLGVYLYLCYLLGTVCDKPKKPDAIFLRKNVAG